ncbi:MAG: hypothetical protein ACI9HK_004893 [Pirellulaceae bacterium]
MELGPRQTVAFDKPSADPRILNGEINSLGKIMKYRFLLTLPVLIVSVSCWLGCGGEDTTPDPVTPEVPVEEPAPPVEEDPAVSIETPPATENVKAEVGVGVKGRSLDNETGIGRAIAQPAISLFAAKERIVFEIQIPQAVNLFQAIEGRKPNSDEEFMEKIVKANSIKLPKLTDGGRYYYDPESAELMVERPKQ